LIPDECGKGVPLIIDLVKGILPKDVQGGGCDEETADRHPQTVGECGNGKGDDKDGEDGGDEDDEGFGGNEFDVQDCEVIEETVGRWTDIHQPVCDDGKEEGDYNWAR
jgi:hypothetical protein